MFNASVRSGRAGLARGETTTHFADQLRALNAGGRRLTEAQPRRLDGASVRLWTANLHSRYPASGPNQSLRSAMELLRDLSPQPESLCVC